MKIIKILCIMFFVSFSSLINSLSAQITNTQVIANGLIYWTHDWTATSNNIWNNVYCGSKNVNTPFWVEIGTNESVPYCWGGNSSISDFDYYLTQNKSAGDDDTNYGFGAEPQCAVGVDCSGFVSRCYGLNTHYSTSMLDNNPLFGHYSSFNDLQNGDFINNPGSHCRLVVSVNDNGTLGIVESGSGVGNVGQPGLWRVFIWTYTISELSAYNPQYYTNTVYVNDVPELQYSDNLVHDGDGAGQGNGNGLAEPGEEIDLDVELYNAGAGDATDVYGTLSTSDPDINITDDEEYWGDIPAGEYEWEADFDFDVDANCPEKDVQFTLDIVSNEGSWTEYFTLHIYGVVQQPELQYSDNLVKDGDGGGVGNENGLAEPGEEIELDVELYNAGAGDATDVYGTLSTSDPDINITDDEEYWGDIPSGVYEWEADFDFDIDPNCPEKDVQFTLEIVSNEGSWTEYFTLHIYEGSNEDITASNGQVYPSEVYGGEDVDLEVDHEYWGNLPSNDPELNYLYMSFYLSTDCTKDDNDVWLTPPVESDLGSDYPVDHIVVSRNIPAGITPGNYYIIFYGDDADNYNEDDETNNSDCVPITILEQPVPECTSLITPQNGDSNVPITTNLSWSPVSEANGYKLSVGTSPGGTQIVNNHNNGNATNYNFSTNLPCNSDIYVRITPYNNAGDAIGCSEESFSTEYVNANAGSDQEMCAGESVQLNASGGTSYSWSPQTGLNNPNIANPIASPTNTTNYTVTVSNSNGCSDTDNVLVTVHSLPAPNAVATDETGFDFNDGTATCNPSNGISPYSYSWSNGQNTQTIINLSPGNYTVTVEDAEGCENNQTVTVDAFICPGLSVYANQNEASCYGACDGTIDIYNVVNGVPPFSYNWSTGDNSSEITDLCSGWYSVTVTDSKNCSVSESFYISEPAELQGYVETTDETGNNFNDGTATVYPNGGELPYNYYWSDGSSTQSISNLSPGTYYVTVTDGNNCEYIDYGIVAEFGCENLIVDAVTNEISCYQDCNGQIDIINVINGTPPFNYYWSNGSDDSFVTNLCSGTYWVTVEDANGCDVVDNFYLGEPEEIELEVTTIDESAYGANDGSATVYPSGGTSPYSYTWSNGGTTQTVYDLEPGNYSVTVTDYNGCEEGFDVYINPFLCPDLQLSVHTQDVLCFGDCNGSIQIDQVINGVQPFIYQWSNGSSDEIISDLCPGDYSVTIVDNVNCEIISDAITIYEPNELSVELIVTDETENNGNDGSVTAIVGGGIAPYSYAWSNGETSNSIEDLAPGIFSLIVTDSNGCEVEESAVVAEYGCAELQLDYNVAMTSCDNSCDGSIEITDVENGVEPFIIIWEDGQEGSIQNALCEGVYQLTVTDANNCVISGEISVTSPPELTVSINITHESSSDANDGSILLTPSGGTAPYSFEWSNGSTGQFINNLSPGIYNVTIIDSNGCSVLESIEIFEFGCEALSIEFIQTNNTCYQSCNGEIIVSQIVNGTLPFDYSWSTGSAADNLTNLCAGIYGLTITDSNNCTATNDFEITEPSLLVLESESTAESFPDANDGSATVSVSGGVPPYSYLWSNGDTNAMINNISAGNYEVSVTDNNGCFEMLNIVVNLDGCETLTVNAQQIDESCQNECDGVISILNVENSAQPLEYSWSNGMNVPLINNLCSDSYIVTITDNLGCIVIDTFEIENLHPISVDLVSMVDITNNGYGAIILQTNDPGSFEYEWNGPNDFISTDLYLVNLVDPGCYELTIHDTDSGCILDTTFCIDKLTQVIDYANRYDEISIYPNPSTDIVFVDFSEVDFQPEKLVLFDVNGIQITAMTLQKGEDLKHLDVVGYEPGLYFIKIEFENMPAYYRRIVISN